MPPSQSISRVSRWPLRGHGPSSRSTEASARFGSSPGHRGSGSADCKPAMVPGRSAQATRARMPSVKAPMPAPLRGDAEAPDNDNRSPATEIPRWYRWCMARCRDCPCHQERGADRVKWSHHPLPCNELHLCSIIGCSPALRFCTAMPPLTN